MSIKIPEEYKDFYLENWYFLSKWHDFWDIPKEYIEKYASFLWDIIYQESENILSKDITPNSEEYNESPATGNQKLGLHTDSFFREINLKPEAILLLCINPWKGFDGRPTMSNIEYTLEEYIKIYWIEEYNKLLRIKLYFDKRYKTFMFWDINTKIFQEFKWEYMNWRLLDKWFFSIMDNMERDKNLENFQILLNKNMKILPRLVKWDIICINNKTFAHWRTWPISKDRYLIRIHIK